VRVDTEQVLCRFQLSSLVRHLDEPLYQWIVHVAHREGLQGATVLKGFMGLKEDGSLLRGSCWARTQQLPVIVEVVDGPRHIEKLLARIEPEFREGTITLERAHVVFYRAGKVPDRTVHVVDVIASQQASVAREVKTMKLPEEGLLLRIFIGEGDREPGRDRPLYEAIVMRAREAQMAGATVIKGPLGFGKHSRLHAARLVDLSTDLPIVIEIVDSQEKINAFLPTVDELVLEGLVSLEAVGVLKSVAGDRPG
jgi:PII-like signaling protein